MLLLAENHKKETTMGLFGKKKEQEKPQEEPTISTESNTVYVNITEKMLRVELEKDHGFARYVQIKEREDRIQIISDGIIIAEIGKRGKAYKELEPYIGFGAEHVAIDAKTGEYGDYYRLKLKFSSAIIVER